ncbi:MAG: fimbrillin family protein [Bacteroidales bacterium]|nr:fimbrillin family protein [Bacteroidales bacterium]
MKKIMILAVAAIAMVACTKTYEVVETSQEQSPIGFGTWTDVMTKSRSAGTGSFTNGDKFDVYGTKTVSENTTTVFNGVAVSYNGTVWSYSPVRFWDKSASNYTFYAVLPFVDSNNDGANDIISSAGSGNTFGQFTSTSIVFNEPTTNNQDILVASKYSRNASLPDTPITTNEVQLAFNHIASLVDIKVKKDQALENANATVKIIKAQLDAIKNTGSFSVSGYDNSSNVPTFTGTGWTPDATPTTTTYYPSVANTNGTLTSELEVSSNTTYDDNGLAGTTTPDANALFSDYVVMPQVLGTTASDQRLVITYSITTGTAPNADVNTYTDVAINLASFVKADNNNPNPDNKTNAGAAITSWMPGTHYTYYVTIGANAITFTATVNNWSETVNGYHYLVN